MDNSETYMNKKPTKTGSRAPSRDDLSSTYTSLNIRKVERLTNTQTDGLDPTYSQLNFRHNGPVIAKDEDPPFASGPGETPLTAQAGPHTEQPKDKIRNRLYRKICLLCLVTSVLITIVAGLSIYVSQIRHSLITCDRGQQELWEQYQEMNRTQRRCRLQNDSIPERKLFVPENENSVLKIHISDLIETQTDLRQKISDLEIKYRTLNGEKAQICSMLTSRKEQACFQDWIRNEDSCYFISTLETSYDGAKRYCSNIDASLLEINSKKEQNVISNVLVHQDRIYRIGKCADGEEASSVINKVSSGTSVCVNCDSSGWRDYCKRQHPFICEKSAHWCTDFPEEIQDLCQQSAGQT
ncbi:uncharacterized protein [Hemitrygon akajei]|uniref:uncharacterized protein n=1 Tax=Hemitrygon akajei TaxID=2704970 RepID=UPI003BF99B02